MDVVKIIFISMQSLSKLKKPYGDSVSEFILYRHRKFVLFVKPLTIIVCEQVQNVHQCSQQSEDCDLGGTLETSLVSVCKVLFTLNAFEQGRALRFSWVSVAGLLNSGSLSHRISHGWELFLSHCSNCPCLVLPDHFSFYFYGICLCLGECVNFCLSFMLYPCWCIDHCTVIFVFLYHSHCLLGLWEGPRKVPTVSLKRLLQTENRKILGDDDDLFFHSTYWDIKSYLKCLCMSTCSCSAMW